MKKEIAHQQKGQTHLPAGQAAILIVFVIGMVSFLIGSSLVKTGFLESITGRKETASAKAFYAANSGIEDAFYQIALNSAFASGTKTYNLSVGEATAEIKVSEVAGTDKRKTIESVGKYDIFTRKIIVTAENTSSTPGFAHAVHAGQGGLELENNTLITSDTGGEGNVFSNSSIWGAKSSCGTSGSKISGSVWVVEAISKLPGSGNDGICIGEDAHAANLEYCYINGIPYSDNALSGGCSSPNAREPEPTITPFPLPNMGISSLKNFVQRKKIFNGDCLIGTPSDCYTIKNGVATIGEIYINGNLIKPNATDLNISGPIYVTGDITFGTNSTIGPDSSLADEHKCISQMVVAQGKITSASNISYENLDCSLSGSGEIKEIFLLFISDRDPPAGDMCNDPTDLAIELESNSNTVLFYATKACVSVKTTSSTSFHGAILGEKIRITANTTLIYDPVLQAAIFGLTKSGGWQIVSFREE